MRLSSFVNHLHKCTEQWDGSAGSACGSGSVLYRKNIKVHLPPCSICLHLEQFCEILDRGWIAFIFISAQDQKSMYETDEITMKPHYTININRYLKKLIAWMKWWTTINIYIYTVLIRVMDEGLLQFALHWLSKEYTPNYNISIQPILKAINKAIYSIYQTIYLQYIFTIKLIIINYKIAIFGTLYHSYFAILFSQKLKGLHLSSSLCI